MAVLMAAREPLMSNRNSRLYLDDPASVSRRASSEIGLSTSRESEHILDYYHSEDAGRGYIDSKDSLAQVVFPRSLIEEEKRAPVENMSTTTEVSKDGKSGGYLEAYSSAESTSHRRTSQGSAGAADRRRLAIVETDPWSEMKGDEERTSRSQTGKRLSTNSNLFTRRGLDASRLTGLALVAPPDAQLEDYTSYDPVPASAPPTGMSPSVSEGSASTPRNAHQRSMSDAQTASSWKRSKRSPRDVGIVGALGTVLSIPADITETPQRDLRQTRSVERESYDDSRQLETLHEPVFQTPRSRSPSPLPSESESFKPAKLEIPKSWTPGSQPITPSIGQEKDVRRPVAGPVVVDLGAGYSSARRSPGLQSNSSFPSSGNSPKAGYFNMDKEPTRSGNRLPFKPNQGQPVSYLHYQPGLHATAGPLPQPPKPVIQSTTVSPPPRPTPVQSSTAPPPRPPRMLSPPSSSRRATTDSSVVTPKTTPESLSAKLPRVAPLTVKSREQSSSGHSSAVASSASSASEGPSRPASSRSLSMNGHAQSDCESSKPASIVSQTMLPNHVREGAFPPSTIISPPNKNSFDESNLIEPMKAIKEDIEPKAFAARSQTVEKASNGEAPRGSRDGHTPLSDDNAEDFSPPSSYASSDEGDTTQVAIAITMSDEEYEQRRKASLPAPPAEEVTFIHPPYHPPSLLSMTGAVRSSVSLPSPIRKKNPPSAWPDSLNCRDILALKTPSDRAKAYASRLQDLYCEETGLKEWLFYASRRVRREMRRENSPSKLLTPNMPSTNEFMPQPRHTSGASIASEVTFPIRRDAYTATDLTVVDTSDVSSTLSPNLPYPSLAQGVGVRKRSSRTLTPSDVQFSSPATSTRTLGGGFFASIGRKASIRKDRPLAPTPSTKSMNRQSWQPPPRPPTIEVSPSLPGGPRAPARPSQRLHSALASKAQPHQPMQEITISSPLRPSLDTPRLNNPSSDPSLERLVDLLPHVDPDILAGYLRRAKSDPMVAITNYLEDEKRGHVRSGTD